MLISFDDASVAVRCLHVYHGEITDQGWEAFRWLVVAVMANICFLVGFLEVMWVGKVACSLRPRF